MDPTPPAPSPAPSPAPPSPLRVLVNGASTVVWTSWMGGPRSDHAFPRVLEDRLRVHGHQAEVRCAALLGAPTTYLRRDWERDVLQWSPDAIVTVVGHYETLHLLLPHWFERTSNRVDKRPGPIRTPWQRTVVRGVWKAAAGVQARVDARVPLDATRRRLDRVEREYAAYVGLCQQVASPAMLAVESPSPPPSRAAWFPGMPARNADLQARLRRLVDRLDLPHVRYVPIADLIDTLYGGDLAQAVPDGFHLTPALHRAVGERLGDQVAAWAATQPHLAVPAPRVTQQPALRVAHGAAS